MKVNTLIFFALLASIAFSCSDDEPDYKFLNRDAAGKIDNISWMYIDGYASVDDLGGGSTRVFVDLVLAQTQEGCDISSVEGDVVFFSVPNKKGVYKLDFSFTNPSPNDYTVTLFDDKGVDSMNYIAANGAVEILEITDDYVSGRLDARVDSKTFVNGNFTVAICH